MVKLVAVPAQPILKNPPRQPVVRYRAAQPYLKLVAVVVGQ